LTINDVGIDI
jgi:hypothetical protein